MNTKIKTVAAIACGIVAYGMSQSAQASPNLVQNGGFETTTGGSTGQLGFGSPTAFGATSWTANGDAAHNYDFVFSYATATTTGSSGIDGSVSLYGPIPTPSGGANNFLGIDPVYNDTVHNEAPGNNWVSQQITGLTANATYTLSFYWAAAQQTGFNGTTTEGWNFGLGNTSLNVNNGSGLPQHTFGGWNFYSTTVTATSGSELLKFIAEGGPSSGNPPFDLLDGVTLTQNVPDSSSTAGLLGLGVVAMGVAAGCRRFARA